MPSSSRSFQRVTVVLGGGVDARSIVPRRDTLGARGTPRNRPEIGRHDRRNVVGVDRRRPGRSRAQRPGPLPPRGRRSAELGGKLAAGTSRSLELQSPVTPRRRRTRRRRPAPHGQFDRGNARPSRSRRPPPPRRALLLCRRTARASLARSAEAPAVRRRHSRSPQDRARQRGGSVAGPCRRCLLRPPGYPCPGPARRLSARRWGRPLHGQRRCCRWGRPGSRGGQLAAVGPAAPRPAAAARWCAQCSSGHRPRRELGRSTSTCPVVVIQPGPDDVQAMGLDLGTNRRRAAVARNARATADRAFASFLAA